MGGWNRRPSIPGVLVNIVVFSGCCIPAASGQAIPLPPGTRGWECIPGVIRATGRDSFRLEVDTNGPVQSVVLTLWPGLLGPASGLVPLHDDGIAPDTAAGDFVFTAGPFRYDVTRSFRSEYSADPASAAGVDMLDLGTVEITELDGGKTGFLVEPAVGALAAHVPLRPAAQLTSTVAFSKHLINVAASTHETQKFLRSLGGDLRNLTLPVYRQLPDSIHFLMLFSTYKIELLPRTAPANFVAGNHSTARIDYTGTGRAPVDNSGFYGSNHVLLSINAMDAYGRGVYAANALHELEHQWGLETGASPGLTDDTSHYNPRSSVGSLLGGQRWDRDGGGQWIMNCDEGRLYGGHRASPLDLYLMGLLDASSVPGMYVYSSSSPPPFFRCGQIIDDIVETVTIGQIQTVYGVRSPGPPDALRHFTLGFIAESNGRLLNLTEMTFYDIFAEHFTSAVPKADPDPYVGFNWPSISRFFGSDVTWSSAVRQRMDLDRDGDVDDGDVAIFRSCPGRAAVPVTPECAAGDLDGDGDADLSDFGILQRCFSGSGQPPEPTCGL